MRAQDERGMVQIKVQTAIVQIVRNMLADGLRPAMIMEYTGLSAEEIAALSNSDYGKS